ncbi:AsmA family protein [Stappia stellulata]|uniref:AsmA family protein n=1 Tax=Stappia stellulata TaxID=71235 RepID=UPI0003F6FB93|nr:AsmA family protein [Stappia stellulata]
MKRVVVGLLSLFFILALVVLVVPLLLPKDAIRAELIARIEANTGWRLRLDGPVGLSLLPGFRMTAEDVGISAASGADGVEFARAAEIDFGLAWSGLFGGDIRLTHVNLDQPVILAEIGPDGTTSWSPRPAFPVDRWTSATQAISQSNGDAAPVPAPSAPSSAPAADTDTPFLARIGIDRLTIVDGQVTYDDRRSGLRHTVEAVNLTLQLPSLAGPLELDGSVGYRDLTVALTGVVSAPLALSEGGASAVDLTVSAADAQATIEGDLAPSAQSRLRVSANGDGLTDLFAGLRMPLARDPGPYALASDLSVSAESLEIGTLSLRLAGGEIRGQGKVRLDAPAPEIDADLTLSDLGLSQVLTLAGRSEQARGTLGGEIALATRGRDTATLLGALDVSGRLTLTGGGIDDLPVPAPIGDDPAARRIDDLALALDFAGVDGPVALSGGFVWRGETFRVEGGATPSLLMTGLPAPVKVEIAGSRASTGFEGALSPEGALDGGVFLETADLRALASWLGTPLPDGGGLRAFSFSGDLEAASDLVRFSDAALRLDDIEGRGRGEVSLGGARPRVSATLALRRLGLDPYLGSASGSATAGASGAAGPGAGAGAPVDAGWSRDPLDLAALKTVDAELDLSAETISASGIEIGRSRLQVALSDGRLTAELAEMALYEGAGRATLVLDGSGSVPQVSVKGALENVSARPFLSALADFDWIQGRVAASMDLSAQGASQAELVEALAGQARFDFSNGAILGLNIPQMVRGLTVDTLLGWSENPAQKTDFSVLAASFAVDRGIATSSDLEMVGPLVRLTGAGTVDMPQKTLDWRLEPRVVADLGGAAPVPRDKGEARELDGLGVPVIVRGSWARPRIYPDIKGILDNPQAALKQLESLGGGLFKGVADSVPSGGLGEVANEALQRATGGNTEIDVQKVLDGEVDDKEVLDAVEQGFGLPSGFLGSFGLGQKKQDEDRPPVQ